MDEGEEVAFPCWRAEWARKAARKLERKGRFDGIFALCMILGFVVVGVLGDIGREDGWMDGLIDEEGGVM